MNKKYSECIFNSKQKQDLVLKRGTKICKSVKHKNNKKHAYNKALFACICLLSACFPSGRMRTFFQFVIVYGSL